MPFRVGASIPLVGGNTPVLYVQIGRREELSVREHMSIVPRKLQGRKFLEFETGLEDKVGDFGALALVV